jgi:hypothetical protein
MFIRRFVITQIVVWCVAAGVAAGQERAGAAETHESHLQDPPEAKDNPDQEDPVEVAKRQHERNLASYEARQEAIKSDAGGPFAGQSADGEELDSAQKDEPDLEQQVLADKDKDNEPF